MSNASNTIPDTNNIATTAIVSASEGRPAPAPSPNGANGDRAAIRSTVNGKNRTVNGDDAPSTNGPNGDRAPPNA
jgi:hypothetical protein